MDKNKIKELQTVLSNLKYNLDWVLQYSNEIESNINNILYKNKSKREWYNYTLPKVLLDATAKRGFYTWGDLTNGSKNGFRHNILLWALPKLNHTYQKRIKTIINSYYKG